MSLPELVVHYIAEHSYAPPNKFIAAVMACPPMGSREYLKRIRELAPKRVIDEPGLAPG